MRIGFVGTRFAGLDGVSLEAAKVAHVLRGDGHEIVWFAGELDSEFSPGVEVPLARFDTPENLALQDECFGVHHTPAAAFALIEERAARLEGALRAFIADYAVDTLVVQQAMAIPMQLPLGVALARLAQSGIPMVAHHHDFAWERERFSPNGVAPILETAFPPVSPNLKHVVINSIAQRELADQRGAGSTVLPNVMDFESPPSMGDSEAFRRYADLSPSHTVLLQATRIIPRKSIELVLELAAKLDDPTVAVVVTHPELDEGVDYADHLVRRAAELGVDFRMKPVGGAGQPTLADAYAAADLVTYPSRIEGFGNALLEAIYYRCPVLINRYPVYRADIEPKGLSLIEIDGAVTAETVTAVRTWLSDERLRSDAADRNYGICLEHYSYETIRSVLSPLIG